MQNVLCHPEKKSNEPGQQSDIVSTTTIQICIAASRDIVGEGNYGCLLLLHKMPAYQQRVNSAFA